MARGARSRTIEKAVRNEATGGENFFGEGVLDQGLAGGQGGGVLRAQRQGARQLLAALALHVAPVVLIKVGQLIVQVHWRLHVLVRGEGYCAQRLRAACGGSARDIRASAIVLFPQLNHAIAGIFKRSAQGYKQHARGAHDNVYHSRGQDGRPSGDGLVVKCAIGVRLPGSTRAARLNRHVCFAAPPSAVARGSRHTGTLRCRHSPLQVGYAERAGGGHHKKKRGPPFKKHPMHN